MRVDKTGLFVAVIAGTPVDTQMGVDFLASKGVRSQGYPAAPDAQGTMLMQLQPIEEREAHISELIEDAKKKGCNAVMIYCNLLSSIIDSKRLAAKHEIPVVTPLDAYSRLAKNYRSIAVMAGSSHALAGIESIVAEISPDTDFIGLTMLPLTKAVEEKIAPDILVRDYGLDDLMTFFEKNGVEALILGCTHFPYLKEAMENVTNIMIVDPADIVFELILEEVN